MKAFFSRIRTIEIHDVVSSGILYYELIDLQPWKWTKQALTTLVDPLEAYIVEVIAESHM